MSVSIDRSAAIVVPNTKKLGSLETPRQKVVRRVLRAYKAAIAALDTPRADEFAKKVEHQFGKLDLLRGNPTVWGDSPLDATETLAFTLAGFIEAPKAAKAKAPARKKAPAKAKAAKPAPEKAAEPAETA